jgi:hypothetical protein
MSDLSGRILNLGEMQQALVSYGINPKINNNLLRQFIAIAEKQHYKSYNLGRDETINRVRSVITKMIEE